MLRMSLLMVRIVI